MSNLPSAPVTPSAGLSAIARLVAAKGVMRKEEASEDGILYVGTPEDLNYLYLLKPILANVRCHPQLRPPTTLAELLITCKSKHCTKVLSSSPELLNRLLHGGDKPRSAPKISEYLGSYFTYGDLEIVFISPLKNLRTVPHNKFLTERLVTKLTKPASWLTATDFQWDQVLPSNVADIYSLYETADAIVIDIETKREPLAITMIGYTGIFFQEDKVLSHTCVLLMDSDWALAWMRKFNSLPAPKIMQNGKYDTAYLLRYSAVPYNYLYDTANMFHSYYCEMPKDLAFLGAFFVREARFWKDLNDSPDPRDKLLYNAKDTWNTANVFLAMINEMPEWAIKNYLMEFPVIFPCVMSEARGIKRDMDRLIPAAKEIEERIASKTAELQHHLGVPGFNTNSPKQVAQLLHVLGCQHLKSTEESELNKAIYAHPLNAYFLNIILDIRGDRKLISTYLPTGEEAKEFYGRILYSINPHGTDTGRNSSAAHHFWSGYNIQNQPRGPDVKRTLIADDGFLFAESDLEQAESRDTAYISGDKNLIAAISSGRDFHSTNASAFFGVPYELIYDDYIKKVIDKALRDLAKRTNHGATYVMGPAVMVDTMGYERIAEAKRLLKLPPFWTPIQVTGYLLSRFHAIYSTLESVFYQGVIKDVVTTKMLVGATGWTRYCFKDPLANKRDKNSYVAHVPQSLNAMVLNKAYLRVFYEIAIHPEHKHNFKLLAQIHDSILFQFRIGHEYLMSMVKECMEIPVTVKGYDGVTRTFTVPASLKAGKDGEGAKYWSDTE
jgi:DNA polymerase I-like protein with 3'-5' exonuclease and polymerase domains